jgi:uroporphyrinogen decarboxylase
MTTPLERLTATAQGQKTDRIPVFCNLLDQGAQELGLSLKEYYAKGEHVAEGQLRLQRKYGHDNLWGLFYVGKEAELLGCRHIVFADNGPPNVGEMVIRTLDDIDRLQVPDDITAHPAFAEIKTCMEILRREAGGRCPICAYVTSSMTLPALLMGMEKWLELLLTGPAEARDRLLVKCNRFFRQEIRAYREAGANVLVYANPFGSLDIISPTFFRELSLPWIRRDLEEGGVDGVVYYCGGARMNPVIDQVFEATGIGTYYLSPLDDIATGKQAINGRALCGGVINDIALIGWSPDQVRQEVQRMLQAGMPGGKFFFGTILMPLAVPEANIRAMISAAKEFGAADA